MHKIVSHIKISIYICAMLKDGRKLDKSAQQELRLRAIALWRKNQNMRSTAEVLQIPYVTIRKWVSKYEQSGSKSLVSDKRGRPKGKELSAGQERTIIKYISSKQPEQLQLSFGLWTRENVAELIYKEFGIRRSVWQIGRYLQEWGFTPQKPVYKAYEQQSKLVQNWLQKDYPLIKEKAGKSKAMIFWGDETSVRSKDVRGRSYAPAGKTPVIRRIGKQFGITMISAVNNRGKLYFQIHSGAINAERFIDFCARLIKQRKEKIFLIVDNLPSHKTLSVREWVWNNRKRIQLFHLPPYSPELNPDKYLNQDLKANITGKIHMKNPDDLKNGVTDFMKKRKSKPNQIKKYFQHPKVKYAA